ncbi:MAG: hypothetical protein QOD32_8, partial [Pyrinomonadaceae bacterium]|nr:hypothetical protein [Pyrinomonadaceae bacterium]
LSFSNPYLMESMGIGKLQVLYIEIWISLKGIML